MAYDWTDKRSECYRLYVDERMDVEKIMDHFRNERHFAPSRRAFLAQFKKWDFPNNQSAPDDDGVLVGRIKELWEADVHQRDMLGQLHEEGYSITEREMMRIRGKNRWLLPGVNGGVSAANGTPDNDGITLNKQRRGRRKGEHGAQPVAEADPTVLERKQEALQKRQAESDERWVSRKRRRRTREYAGLPADPEGPPRFPSETTLDESKVILRMDNETYRQIRDRFQAICEEQGITKKSEAGPEKWCKAKDRLIKEDKHLNQVLYHDSIDSREQKLMSLDVVCLDVTKRMRVMQNRVSIIDAKNVLSINPEETRQLRAAFFAKLHNEHFASKTELGKERWAQLKSDWISESPLLQRIVDADDPDHEKKQKAVEMLCRDVMKRLRDELSRRNPDRQRQGRGPGPGPAPPRQPGSKDQPGTGRETSVVRVAAPTQNHATQPAPSDLFASADLEIDPSLLLAASDALPHILDDHEDYPDTSAAPPQTFDQAAYADQQQTTIGIFMRLSSHSPWQAEPRLWLGTMTAGTLLEIKQQIAINHPRTAIIRISGIVKASSGAEIYYTIDDDEKLAGYLVHTSGGDAMFEVTLVPAP